jgi:hypothetical protein
LVGINHLLNRRISHQASLPNNRQLFLRQYRQRNQLFGRVLNHRYNQQLNRLAFPLHNLRNCQRHNLANYQALSRQITPQINLPIVLRFSQLFSQHQSQLDNPASVQAISRRIFQVAYRPDFLVASLQAGLLECPPRSHQFSQRKNYEFERLIM